MKKIFLCILLVASGIWASNYKTKVLERCENGDKEACGILETIKDCENGYEKSCEVLEKFEAWDNCFENKDKQACRTLIIKGRVGCKNYEADGCLLLAITYDFNNRDLFYKNITYLEALKNRIKYMMKACILGDYVSCEVMEGDKMFFENCKDFSKMSMSECLKDLQ